jgi:hypothetical protein
VLEETRRASPARVVRLTLKSPVPEVETKLAEEKQPEPHVRWSEDTINNEHMKRKTSKRRRALKYDF